MSELESAKVASRLNRLPPSRTMWVLIVFISLGGIFDVYDASFTGYIGPEMARSGLFTSESLGVFAVFGGTHFAGFGTFIFCTYAGVWFGVVVLGRLPDRLGRRTVFKWALIWYTVCTAIMAFQQSGEMLDILRLFAGAGFGAQGVTIDSYISELSPDSQRGRGFAINQFIVYCIVPLVAFLAWILAPVYWLHLEGWRWVILIGSMGALLVLPLVKKIPESPRWLALKGKVQDADAVMLRIERQVCAEIGHQLPPPKPLTSVNCDASPRWEIFSRRYRKRTIALSIFNITQVIGYYGFFAWLPTLLIGHGITLTDSLEYSFIIALAQPIGPLVGIFFADRIGRKQQIVTSLALMGLVMLAFPRTDLPWLLIVLGILFTVAATVMSYAYHAYEAEVYPTRFRARAISFVYSWSRLSAALSGVAIGYLLSVGGQLIVGIFIALAMVVSIASIGIFGPRVTE